MARRPDLRNFEKSHSSRCHSREQEDAALLTEGDLAEMRRGLSRLSIDAVRHAYHTAYARCRMVNDHAPSPRSIQELVQIWRQLWKWR